LLDGVQPSVRSQGAAACRIGYCGLWAHPGAALCYGHRRRWKQRGCPDLEEFARACETPAGERERADLRPLPRQLRLELQYALPCRQGLSDFRCEGFSGFLLCPF
jgi:hypothetical protein